MNDGIEAALILKHLPLFPRSPAQPGRALLFCGLALALCASPLPAKNAPAREGAVNPHLKKGSLLLDAEDWDGALREYREAVQLDPNNAEGHIGVGQALGEKGDHQGALAEFREGLRLEPGSAEAHNGVGWILSSEGDIQGALKEFREAVRLKPDYAKAHFNIGWVLDQQGDLAGAAGEYREAIRLKPDDPDSHDNLGWVLGEQNDFDSAVREYREGIRLKPGDADSHDGLAWILYRKRDWEGALAEYHEAIRLKPNDPDTHIAFGTALDNRGDLEGALHEYREAVRLKPDSAEAHTDVGLVLSAKGDMRGAIAEFQNAIQLRPEYGEAHARLAMELRKKGDWNGAYVEASRAAQAQPNLSLAHLELGLALEHRGDRKGALDEYRKAYQLDPHFTPAADNYQRLTSELRFLPGNWSPAMVHAFSIVAALIPAFLLLGYFRARDLYPEPARALWATFALGALIVYPVLLIDRPLDLLVQPFHSPLAHGLAEALFTAALPEELMKFAVVMLFCARLKVFNEPMDGIVYGAVASLGFAAFENIGYVTASGLGVAISRAFTSVPCHAFMGAVMGYFVGQWRFGPAAGRTWALVKAYAVPVTLHWAYDFPLLAAGEAYALSGRAQHVALLIIAPLALVSVGILVFAAVWAVRLVNRLHKEQIQLARDAVAAAAAEEGAMDIVALVNAPEPPRSTWPGWIMAVVGGFIAFCAGTYIQVVLVDFIDTLARGVTDYPLFSMTLAGVIPLLIGMVLFIYGANRIHAGRRRVPPRAAAPAVAAPSTT
jgi:tetratricopeptide (TPR) repeat protein